MFYQIFLDRFSLLGKVSCCVLKGKVTSDRNRTGDSGVSQIVLSFLKDLSIKTLLGLNAVVRHYSKSTERHFVDTF